MSKIYIENGSYIVELEDYDGSSITNMRVAEASAPNTWYTFSSVALEAPNPSYDGAYIGTHDHKFVGFGANEAGWAGNNFIIFTPTGLAAGQITFVTQNAEHQSPFYVSRFGCARGKHGRNYGARRADAANTVANEGAWASP